MSGDPNLGELLPLLLLFRDEELTDEELEWRRWRRENNPALVERIAFKALCNLRDGRWIAEAFRAGGTELETINQHWWCRCSFSQFDVDRGEAEWNGVRYVGILARRVLAYDIFRAIDEGELAQAALLDLAVASLRAQGRLRNPEEYSRKRGRPPTARVRVAADMLRDLRTRTRTCEWLASAKHSSLGDIYGADDKTCASAIEIALDAFEHGSDEIGDKEAPEFVREAPEFVRTDPELSPSK